MNLMLDRTCNGKSMNRLSIAMAAEVTEKLWKIEDIVKLYNGNIDYDRKRREI